MWVQEFKIGASECDMGSSREIRREVAGLCGGLEKRVMTMHALRVRRVMGERLASIRLLPPTRAISVVLASTLLALMTLVFAAPSDSRAQAVGGYLPPLPIPDGFRERQPRHNALKSSVRTHFMATAFDAQAQADLKDWYQNFYFRAFTDPNYFSEISKMRVDFIRSLTLAKSQETRNFVVELAFSTCKVLTERNFPPATRINAMLLIAELNQEDRTLGAGGNPVAIPYGRALAYMREQLKSPTQIDGVRVAALGGILRHVETQWWLIPRPQINENVMREISRDMVALAKDEKPPEGRSLEGHAWIRSRAVDILGSLVALVPSSEAFDVMVKISGNPQNPTWLRARAANALARVDYNRLPAADRIDKAKLAGHLAGFLADTCRLVVDRLEDERNKAQQGRMGGGGMGGMGGMPDMGMMGGGMMGGGMAPGMDDPSMDMGYGGMGGMMGGMPGTMGGGVIRRDRSGVPTFIIDAAKRRLAYESYCVRAAVVGPSRDADFKGILAFSQDDQQAQQTITRIRETLKRIDELVKDDEVMLVNLVRDLRIELQDLERLRPEPTVTQEEVAEIAPLVEEEVAGDVTVPEPSAPLPPEEASTEDLPDEADVPAPEIPETVPESEEGVGEGAMDEEGSGVPGGAVPGGVPGAGEELP